MLRAVPAMTSIAWSTSRAFRSGSFVSAIERTCARVSRPTLLRFGSGEPLSTPAAELIKKAAGVAKGSKTPHTDKVGKLTQEQVRQIAETKQPDLNANDLEAAAKIIAGTARSMGITVEG